ncbi:hypothetical protein C8R31_102599 [Nitrosospira sp. Nsp2]|nr:hypothetical protein C8R31_102599 [Nitrosospira sp. Nsp2]
MFGVPMPDRLEGSGRQNDRMIRNGPAVVLDL